MTRPRATVDGPDEPDGIGLHGVPDEPHDLTGFTVQGVVSDVESAGSALDAALRGATLAVRLDLVSPERDEFLDHLARVADVNEVVPGGVSRPRRVPGPEHYALLRELKRGAPLHEAARALAMSRRTAARRLSELRVHHRVGTVAELLTTIDD